MGTRKSRHNKGRKPLYKDFERVTIRRFGKDDGEREREKIVPLRKNTLQSWKPSPEPELEELVARYREQRAAEPESALPTKKSEVLGLINGAGFSEIPIYQAIAVSQRDAVLQMYMERKISLGELHAARAWQFDLDRATLQLPRSIDWSAPISGLHYQSCGGVTGQQYAAMSRRRDFASRYGRSKALMLDFYLSGERTRKDLMDALGARAEELNESLGELLNDLCRHRGTGKYKRSVA